ncbi:MAG: hypothetical protein ACE5ID_01920 [Acidobacteriota bacterium]
MRGLPPGSFPVPWAEFSRNVGSTLWAGRFHGAGIIPLGILLLPLAGGPGAPPLSSPRPAQVVHAGGPGSSQDLRSRPRSSHFILVGDGNNRSDRLEHEVLKSLETWYGRFLILFEGQPASPITVHLYSARLFHKLTGAPQWADGLFAPDGTIRLAIPQVGRLEPDLDRVLIHELAHAFITSRSGGQAPRWLQEGLAQILSGTPAPSADRLAHPASTPAGLDHAGALSFTRFLVKLYGMRTVLDLLAPMASGDGPDQVLAGLNGEDLTSQYDAWRQSRRPSAKKASGS